MGGRERPERQWWRGGVVRPGAHERGVKSFAAKQGTAALPIEAVVLAKDVTFIFSGQGASAYTFWDLGIGDFGHYYSLPCPGGLCSG